MVVVAEGYSCPMLLSEMTRHASMVTFQGYLLFLKVVTKILILLPFLVGAIAYAARS